MLHIKLTRIQICTRPREEPGSPKISVATKSTESSSRPSKQSSGTKNRIMAVTKIQRFWRRIRATCRAKRILWDKLKSEKANNRRQQPKAMQNNSKNQQSKAQLSQTQKIEPSVIGLSKEDRFISNYSCNRNKLSYIEAERSKMHRHTEILKALYLGWKTRRIMRNEHLK